MMSISAQYWREDWESGGQFSQVEASVDSVFVVEVHPDGFGSRDWNERWGPPSPLCYEHWQRDSDEQGHLWRLVDSGDDYYDSDQASAWRRYVGERILVQFQPGYAGNIRLSWQSVGRLIVKQWYPAELCLGPGELAYRLEAQMHRVAGAIGAIAPDNQVGFASVYEFNGFRQLFVWNPTAEDHARGRVDQIVYDGLGQWEPEAGNYALEWPAGGTSQVAVRLLGALDCPERRRLVAAVLRNHGYIVATGWQDGRALFSDG
jgi:hypothetical protein